MNRSHYQDYTRSGINQFEQTDIYKKAVSVGERRVKHDPRPSHPDYQRTVVRNVEVPYNRQVRVPTVENKIVPARRTVRVPVKKMVEVPSYRIMDEEYTEWEPQTKVREKEIWVKKIVQETYVENVAVKKVRQVRVPHTEMKEVEEMQDVEVDTNEVVRIPGFRVDEVQDSKVVEVEELENMTWDAHTTGEHQLVKTEEGPVIPGPGTNRKEGAEFYEYGDPHVASLPTDRNANPRRVERPESRQAPFQDTRWNGNGLGRPQSASDRFFQRDSRETAQQPRTKVPSQPMLPLEDPQTTNNRYGWQTSYGTANKWQEDQQADDSRFKRVPGAGEYSIRHTAGDRRTNELNQKSNNKTKGLGMSVKSTATAHTDSYGCVVTKVAQKSPAAFGGLRLNDIIVECQGRRVTSIEGLGAAVQAAAGGLVSMSVNRDGRKGIILALRPAN